MKKLYIKSFGCQMNDHDAEQMVGILKKEGYLLTERQDDADMIIMNTCSIRDKAEQKAYSEFGKLDSLKKLKPDLIIGFAGCVAQQEGAKILKRISNVDFVMGPRNISHLPEIITQVHNRKKVVEIQDESPIAPSRPSHRKEEFKAWITIMEGCDYGCTYCVVPTTRGSERSRPSREIFHEVEALAMQGFKEITLLGQTVNSYGRNLPEIIDFSDLLKILQSIDGIERIRFMTSHPNDLTPKLIQTLRRYPKLCKHIHLPVQSGSDKILSLMKRGYSAKGYLQKVQALRSEMPDLSITSDIITGFPGESEFEFKETLGLLGEVEFDAIFAFKYSNRPNTSAPMLQDQVPEEIKSERLAEILAFQQRISFNKNQRLLGSIQEVLVEGASKNNPERWSGRTGCNRMVHFNSSLSLKGNLVKLRMIEARNSSLEGELV
ncbi:MAG: tRNA (N6-isopentenyl adenosine(37)-C2)-methylthiotransferase MiaB [Nitrospirae bacterium]|nr:tRNA (N6-isopentenyl adenosine(37)-C2)-methylthiotransferase MiaB [Nitrospirota bacterium]